MPIRLLHTVGLRACEVLTLIQHLGTQPMKTSMRAKSTVKMRRNCLQMGQNPRSFIPVDQQIVLALISLGQSFSQFFMCATSR